MATSLQSIKIPPIAIPGQRLAPSSVPSTATTTTYYASGPGTHLQDTYICASIAGPVILEVEEADEETDKKSKSTSTATTITVTVGRSTPTAAVTSSASGVPVIIKKRKTEETTEASEPSTSKPRPPRFNTLPTVDSLILGRITRVQKRQATLSILVVLDPESPPSAAAEEDRLANILAASASNEPNTSLPTTNAEDLRFQALIRREDVRAVEKDKVDMHASFRVGDIVRAQIISVGDQSYYYASTAGNELGVVMARSEGGDMMFPVS
ncbi:exosome 3'-_5 exonuclease subunit ski4 (Csl4) [Ascosphaera atra]|nr:exosome 3'->5 exonuclease subunit ski4 (Csl4) [Ascosphaera atra]